MIRRPPRVPSLYFSRYRHSCLFRSQSIPYNMLRINLRIDSSQSTHGRSMCHLWRFWITWKHWRYRYRIIEIIETSHQYCFFRRRVINIYTISRIFCKYYSFLDVEGNSRFSNSFHCFAAIHRSNIIYVFCINMFFFFKKTINIYKKLFPALVDNNVID